MTGPDQDHTQRGSTPWQRGQNLSQQGAPGNNAEWASDPAGDDPGADDPTTVVSRDEVAGATPHRPAEHDGGYQTAQDYQTGSPVHSGADTERGTDPHADPDADAVHGYPVTRDPEITEAARRTEQEPAAAAEQPPTEWHQGPDRTDTDRPTEEPTRQFSAAPAGSGTGPDTTDGTAADATAAYESPKDAPFGDRSGYQPTPAYSAAPDRAQPQAIAGSEDPNYAAGPDQGQSQTYGSSSTGFFSPQAVQAGRVELAPAKTRIGQNLLGALLGLIFVAGAAALYAVVFKNATGTESLGTGHKLAAIGIALIFAIPALLAGWAPTAAWFPGIVLVLGVGVAMFSNSLASKYAEWSNSLFGTTKAAEVLLNWGMVAGFALLLAGIGAHLGRRSAEHGVVDRIVNR